MDMIIIYKDEVIEVSIIQDIDRTESIALRYVKPVNYVTNEKKAVKMTNNMGGETNWFILPNSFGEVVGKKLFDLKNAGLKGFSKAGFNKLSKWLIEMEVIDNGMSY